MLASKNLIKRKFEKKCTLLQELSSEKCASNKKICLGAIDS